MIKFFRIIRQNLLNEGKTTKYFKYAIGEIVLVVIGILIALSINNWNENQKLNEIRQNYYQQLVLDLDSEIQNLNSKISHIDKSIESYEAYRKIENSNLQPIEIIQAFGKIEYSFSTISFNSNTIETLESTGDIKLIPTIIRSKLIKLKREQESIIDVANGNESEYLNNLQKAGNLGFYGLGKYYTNEAIHKKIKENYVEIILTLEATFMLKNFTETGKIKSLKSMLEKVNELKVLIKQELEN